MSARRNQTVVGGERFAARNQQRSRRRVLVWTAGLGLVAMLGAGVWAVGFSDLTGVERVEVTSDGRELPADLADDLIARADVPLGRPLLRVDTGQVAERLEPVREISAVEVTRDWPRGVELQVVARQPAAAVTDGETWWQVDENGVLFAEAGDQPEDLPVVEVSAADDDQTLRAAAVSVLDALPQELAEQVDEVSANSPVDVRLTLDDGAAVMWGSVDRSEDKSAVLRALIAEQEETPEHYDVSAPDRPAVQADD